MPTVREVSDQINQACAELKAVKGVNGVYLWGSYAQHISDPNYVIKDVDIIAATEFDSGDLFAIDASQYGALKLPPRDLEDFGFNPLAVAFTKRFLSLEKYNIDHWATSSDGKLLHWGIIPDNQEEWLELHTAAENRAKEITGLDRKDLCSSNDAKRKEWKIAYDKYVKKYLSNGTTGWFASKNDVTEILSLAKRV